MGTLREFKSRHYSSIVLKLFYTDFPYQQNIDLICIYKALLQCVDRIVRINS
jgi:hypothetical protein